MLEPFARPRLTRFDDVKLVVHELKKLGVSGSHIYARVTEIGPVDLDMLNEVIRHEKPAI